MHVTKGYFAGQRSGKILLLVNDIKLEVVKRQGRDYLSPKGDAWGTEDEVAETCLPPLPHSIIERTLFHSEDNPEFVVVRFELKARFLMPVMVVPKGNLGMPKVCLHKSFL